MKKTRKPKCKFKSSAQKEAKAANLPSPNKQNPSWRFSHLELVDPFGWHKIGTSKLHEIRTRLSYFESMTWDEILIKNKKNNHSVPFPNISKEAQERLKNKKLDDIDKLVSLRISSIERIWGIRQQGTLLLLWWDPEHQVCPSIKKHT